MGETLTLTAEDGFKLSAYRATPSGKPRGGLVVVQEIFGVNHHIRNVTDGFAADGYVAIAPVIFHFGETDQSIPKDHWDRIKAQHPKIPMHIYPAGHGFACDERGSFHPESAKLARQRTIDFFRQHVG